MMFRGFLIVLWIGTVSIADATESADTLYKQGQRAFQQHDIQAAIVLFEQAALLDHSPSQVRLGWILDGVGDHKKAVDLYRKAAKANDPDGQYFLGEKLISGEGTGKDEQEAAKWIFKAAESRHPAAIRRLAIAYENGDMGLPQDASEAILWLQQGVAQNDSWSIQRLARAYRNGELALSVDERRSSELEALLVKQQ